MKKIALSLTFSLALTGLVTPNTYASDAEGIAASMVEFLTHTLYPDSSALADKEPYLFTASTDLDKAAKKASRHLVLSSLSSTAASLAQALTTPTNTLTDGSTSTNQKGNNNSAQFSRRQMAKFLCSNSKNCLYKPAYKHALLNTLVGTPYGKAKVTLTAPDSLLTSHESQPKTDVFVDGTPTSTGTKTNQYGYFDYDAIFGNHQPASLEPAKYYGLFATGAYDVLLLPEQYQLTHKLKKELKAGNLKKLRHNSTYQQYILLTRKLTAVNSALMSNILWLAKQHAVTVDASNSPTGNSMSQAEVDDYIGNHRLNDGGEWLEKVKNESPTELLREQTLLMAEANHQREESNQLMRRLLATATIAAAQGKEIYQLSAALQAKLGGSR